MIKKDTSIIDFFLGGILFIIGLISIFKNTSVGTLRMYGTNLPSGMVTIPILIAFVLLILNHKSRVGWLLMGIGIVLLLITIISSISISFRTTSLLGYLLMFGGTFGGAALLAKALLR